MNLKNLTDMLSTKKNNYNVNDLCRKFGNKFMITIDSFWGSNHRNCAKYCISRGKHI